MKNPFFIFSIFFGIIGFLLVPDVSFAAATWSIRLTSPSGGEQWEAGRTYSIEWECSNLTDVWIFLTKGDDKVTITGSVGANCPGGSYSWTIPGDIAPGGNYKIAVADQDTFQCQPWPPSCALVNVSSYSGNFTIFNETPQGSCNVPSGGITVDNDKTTVEPGEKFTVSVKGHDDNDVLRLYNCDSEKCYDEKCKGQENDCTKSWSFKFLDPGRYIFSGQVEDSDTNYGCPANNKISVGSVEVVVAGIGSCAQVCAGQENIFYSGDCSGYGFPQHDQSRGLCFYKCSNQGRTLDSGGKNCLCYSSESCSEASYCLSDGCSETAYKPPPETALLGPTPPPETTPGTPGDGKAIIIPDPLGEGTTLEILLNRIIDFIFWVGITLAPVLLIIAGFLYVTSAGDPGRVEKAKKTMLYTLIGLLTLLFARGLVAVLKSIIGAE